MTSRDELKAFFSAYKKPTEDQFEKLIDAFFHKDEDKIWEKNLNDIYFSKGKVSVGTNDAKDNVQLLVEKGAIMPSAGEGDESGILFPSNPEGGGGDSAWIRYFAPKGQGEKTVLELGVSNDPGGTETEDHIALMPSGHVGIGTRTPQAKLQIVDGAIMPSAGDGNKAGILFPPNPGGGGGGDSAWIRYYALKDQGEKTVLELGVSNDPAGSDAEDHIALMPSGNVGIGTPAPEAKLHIKGDLKVEGVIRYGKDTSESLQEVKPVIIETGIVEIHPADSRNKYLPRKPDRKYQKFTKKFSAPPAVFISTKRLDLGDGYRTDLYVEPTDTTKNGFYVNYATWESTDIAEWTINFMAIGF